MKILICIFAASLLAVNGFGQTAVGIANNGTPGMTTNLANVSAGTGVVTNTLNVGTTQTQVLNVSNNATIKNGLFIGQPPSANNVVILTLAGFGSTQAADLLQNIVSGITVSGVNSNGLYYGNTVFSNMNTQSIGWTNVTKTANYSSTTNDGSVMMNGTSITNVLWDATTWPSGTLTIKNINASPLTVAPTNSQTIDGISGSIVELQNESILFQSDGSNWRILGGNDGGLLQTNWISGQLYTNNYGQPVEVSGNATLTVAAVSGNSVMALRVTGTQTNFSGISTLVTSIATSYTNYLSIKVPAGQTWVWTNLSTGVGNSASVNAGQLMTQ